LWVSKLAAEQMFADAYWALGQVEGVTGILVFTDQPRAPLFVECFPQASRDASTERIFLPLF